MLGFERLVFFAKRFKAFVELTLREVIKVELDNSLWLDGTIGHLVLDGLDLVGGLNFGHGMANRRR